MNDPTHLVAFTKTVWRDFTPLGKWTIAVPFIVLCYVALALLIPGLVLLFLMVKSGAAERIERFLDRVAAIFFNGRNNP